MDWVGTKPFDFQPAPPERGRWELHPGEWRPVEEDGKPNARVACPVCGEMGTLDHEISASGNVSPSVQCPKAGCPFHASPSRLLGWPGARP
jgi:hypothetical protein